MGRAVPAGPIVWMLRPGPGPSRRAWRSRRAAKRLTAMVGVLASQLTSLSRFGTLPPLRLTDPQVLCRGGRISSGAISEHGLQIIYQLYLRSQPNGSYLWALAIKRPCPNRRERDS